MDVLLRQFREQDLGRFNSVIALGGKEYRQMVIAVFKGTGVTVMAPFAGLRMGEAMGATKRAVGAGHPLREA